MRKLHNKLLQGLIFAIIIGGGAGFLVGPALQSNIFPSWSIISVWVLVCLTSGWVIGMAIDN